MTLGPYELGKVHRAETLVALGALPDASVDALCCDPPYSSGGAYRGDRMQSVTAKYVLEAGVSAEGNRYGSTREYPDFTGDNRDARSWTAWCMVWLSEARRVVKPGGIVQVFTDWRMLPSATDALQGGGFLWRGVIAWDKGASSRAPHTGYARHQCEYVLWGSAGHLPEAPGRGPFPGCFQIPVKQDDKHHMTGKPTALMRALVKMTAPGGIVLDPFAGSGTTGVACALEGRQFLGFDLSAEYVDVSNARIEAEARGMSMGSLTFDPTQATIFDVPEGPL